MQQLDGSERKYLRGLAHHLNPVIQIGIKGLSEGCLDEIETTLNTHELIKIKFICHKKAEEKSELSARIESMTGAALVGTLGHTVTFFRRQSDPDKQKIQFPSKRAASSKKKKRQ